MLKVKMLDTGKIKEVTNNVAHGLIDAGKAVLYRNKMMLPNFDPELPKKSKKKKKGYKVKDVS